jgi:transcriptional regulator with XRE-family HTH domain
VSISWVKAMTDSREQARKPTLADVARQAGVSDMTVSRVINGGEAVSEARREAVRRAAADLGYIPNRAAQALALARAEAIPGASPQAFGLNAIDGPKQDALIALRLGSALFRTFATSKFSTTEVLKAELDREGLDGESAIRLLLRYALIMHTREASLFLTAQGSHLRHKTTVAILASAAIMDLFSPREVSALNSRP